MPRIVLGLVTVAVAIASGCGKDKTTPPPAAAVVGDELPDEGGDADAAADEPMAEAQRELWFARGHGRDAILARERKDHAAAVAALDALLADAATTDRERAGAQVLRALEDLREDRFVAAADRFAEARKEPSLSPIEVRLVHWEAQARLDAGDAKAALLLVAGLKKEQIEGSVLADDLRVVEADALLRTKDRDGALAKYRGYLRDFPGGDRRAEVRVKLARALAEGEEQTELAEAVSLYEQLRESVPLSDYGDEADRELPGLRAKAKLERTGADKKAYERRLALADLDAMVSRRRYEDATRAADRLLADKGASAADRCRALYLKGSAIFKQRERAKSRAVFEQADRACKDAGPSMLDLRVKSRYQAARGLYAEGKYTQAAKAFEALATEHASDSYADDAWVLAGESWSEQGDEKAARRVYEKAVAVDGDMLDEAQRRLLVSYFAAGEAKEALALCDKALVSPPAGPKEHGKLHYFRGKALAALGRDDEAHAAWKKAVEVAPLEYPGLLALSRLSEVGPEAFDGALALLSKHGSKMPPIGKPGGKSAERALVLARLGLGVEAGEELGEAGVAGWAAVLVLNQAGLFSAAQRTLANLGTGWRAQPPTDDARVHWEAAHPRPFAEIIAPGERSHAVPRFLTFAIMQTESRFDPSVTSWAGAKGLVQLMPATAKGLAEEAGKTVRGDALYDPATNLDLGMRYLGKLAGRWNGDAGAAALAAASYNAGAGAVDRWLGERGDWDLDLFIESIPYDETRRYTQTVVGRWHAYRFLYGEGDEAERIPLLPRRIPKRAG